MLIVLGEINGVNLGKGDGVASDWSSIESNVFHRTWQNANDI